MPPRTAHSKSRLVAAALAIIVFVNAALLFSVEPMFSKLVLPLLGGTPSVWNACLVFFQAALLVGYSYAHALSRIADPRKRAGVHIALLSLSCIALPLAIRASGDPPPGNLGIVWLLGLLVTSLGAPFIMLASGAPLAQQWLANSQHPDADNPYFLYAASNLGSLIALLSYPILIEPRLTLSAQRAAWSIGYGMLVILIAISFAMIAFQNDRITPHKSVQPAAPINARQRAGWVLYAAVPASLLVGVTTFISTDVAAVPLLWVLPLSIYLLTFVIVFSARPLVPHSWMIRAEPHVLVIIAIPIFWGLRLPGLFGIIAHLAVLFVIAMVCHGELARRKPPASQLTEFFVWVAIGGLVGGIFNALIAPIAFNRVYEYPIVLALAGLLHPRGDRRVKPSDVLLPLALGAALLALTPRIAPLPSLAALLVTMVFGVVIFSFAERPMRFGLALTALFVAGQFRTQLTAGHENILDVERSYFGVYRVALNPQLRRVTLHHGTTLHGAQSVIPSLRLVPLTYYHPSGPSGDVFTYAPAAAKPVRNVGVVGLGAGSLACYGHPAEHWTFYEIDPVVARIALDRRLFTFLRDCPPSVRIKLGDARLTLRRAPRGSHDVLVLDAFSSDAIPVHLLTREAFRLYLSLLAPHGVIFVHISNEHVDLEPVLAAVAAELHLSSRVRRDFQIPDNDAADGRTPAVWAVLSRSSGDLGPLWDAARWEPLRERAEVRVWTDDFSNIVQVFSWH